MGKTLLLSPVFLLATIKGLLVVWTRRRARAFWAIWAQIYVDTDYDTRVALSWPGKRLLRAVAPGPGDIHIWAAKLKEAAGKTKGGLERCVAISLHLSHSHDDAGGI